MSDSRTWLVLPITLVALTANAAAQTVRVEGLRTENMVNPIGIDVPAPRLSWMLAADRRGTMQSAYEIRITGDRGVAVWNTGKVASEESVNRVYGGPALAPGKRYTWQVRVWDDRRRASEWSAPAYWETGLMGAANWKAKWIEPDLPEDTTRSNPSPLLRTAFTLNGSVASARAYVTAHGLYELQINGRRVGDQVLAPGWTSYDARLQYQTYDVTALLRRGAV